MIIRQGYVSSNFNKLSRGAATDIRISDGAFRLYGYLLELRNGQNFNDNYIKQALGLSTASLTRRKKELKDNGYLLVEQISSRVYAAYIGNPQQSAEEVKKMWEIDEPVIKEKL